MGMHERRSGEYQVTTSKFYRSCRRCLMETATKRRLSASFSVSDRVERNWLARCRLACGGQKRKLRLCRW